MMFMPEGWDWKWDRRPGSKLPKEFQRYLSDPEVLGMSLGGRIHWSVMVEPTATMLLGVLISLWMFASAPPGAENIGNVAFILLVIVSLRWVFKYYLWNRELIFITGKRVITVTGIINRSVAMMPLSKLTDMNYTRTPWGMLLGYGTFRMESAGQNQAIEMLRRIPKPDESYRYVQNLLFGRGTTDVVLVDVKTEKPVTTKMRERMFPTREGGFRIEPADEDWYEK